MSTPFISVVIPTYNASKFLREALDSLIAQTFTDWEAICVNDGSTDDSLSILQEYAAKDSRFRILDGPNGGYGKAMNRGLDAACGVYTSILEPDDFTPRLSYETLANTAKRYNADIVRGEACYFYENEDGTRVYYSLRKSPAYHCVFAPKNKTDIFQATPHTWTCLYNLDFIRKYNIRYNETPGASYQDTGMFFISAAYAERYVCIPDITYAYRTDNPASSVRNFSRKGNVMLDEFLFIRRKLESGKRWAESIRPHFLHRYLTVNLWMYAALSDDLKPPFLERFCKELRDLQHISDHLLSIGQRNDMKILLQGAKAYTEIMKQRRHNGYRQIRFHGLSYIYEYKNSRTSVLLWNLPLFRYERQLKVSRLFVFGLPLIKRTTSPIFENYGTDFRYISANRRTFYLLGVPFFTRKTNTVEFRF